MALAVREKEEPGTKPARFYLSFKQLFRSTTQAKRGKCAMVYRPVL
jgi:hypothetical protein